MLYDFGKHKDKKFNEESSAKWNKFLNLNPNLEEAHAVITLRDYENFTGAIMPHVDALNNFIDEGIGSEDLIGAFLFSRSFVNIGAVVATFIDFVDGSKYCEALRDEALITPDQREFIKATKEYFDKFIKYHTGKNNPDNDTF